jgi:hypothetical protein
MNRKTPGLRPVFCFETLVREMSAKAQSRDSLAP